MQPHYINEIKSLAFQNLAAEIDSWDVTWVNVLQACLCMTDVNLKYCFIFICKYRPIFFS